MSRAQRRLPRLAVLLPSTDTTVEQEVPALLAGVASCHFARMPLSAVTETGLREMETAALQAAEVVSAVSPDLVLYACTSGTFVLGADHEAELAEELARAAGAPVLTTARAMVDALRRHGRTVRLRTPYDAAVTRAEVGYLSGFGLTVTSTAFLGLTVDDEIAAVPASRLVDHVRGDDAADVVMLSCTNVRTLTVLDRLERAAGAPVVTSNSAGAAAVREALGSPRPS